MSTTITRIKAKDFRYNKAQIKGLESAIKMLLHEINQELNECRDAGKDSIKFSLPILWEIPGMSSDAARNKIYANVISDLTCDERGFFVELKISIKKNGQVDKAVLYIASLSEEEEIIKRYELDILQYYSSSLAHRKNMRKPQSQPFSGLPTDEN